MKFKTFLQEAKTPNGEEHRLVEITASGELSDFLRLYKIGGASNITRTCKTADPDAKQIATWHQSEKANKVIHLYVSFASDKYVTLFLDNLKGITKRIKKRTTNEKESWEMEILQRYVDNNSKVPSLQAIVEYVADLGYNHQERFQYSYYHAAARMTKVLSGFLGPTRAGYYQFMHDKVGFASEIRKKFEKVNTSNIDPARWNPADGWIVAKSKIPKLSETLSNINDLGELNTFISENLDNKSIIPVSLKDAKANLDYKITVINRAKQKFPHVYKSTGVTFYSGTNFTFGSEVLIETTGITIRTQLKSAPKFTKDDVKKGSASYMAPDAKEYQRIFPEATTTRGYQAGVFQDDFYVLMTNPNNINKQYNPHNIEFYADRPGKNMKKPLKGQLSKSVYDKAVAKFIAASGILKGYKGFKSYSEFSNLHPREQMNFVGRACFAEYLSVSPDEFAEIAQKGPLCLINPEASAAYIKLH